MIRTSIGSENIEEANMVRTIGCELEAGFVDSHGRPADTLAILNGGCAGLLPFEQTTGDMALSSIEFVTPVCTSECEIFTSLVRRISVMPNGYRAIFETRPFGLKVRLARKSRVGAMCRALAREHPNGANGVSLIAPHNSTQFHIGAPDLLTERGILFLNFLNNIAPYARLKVIEQYEVKGAEGHFAIWRDFADPRRFPAPRWFANVSALKTFVESVPKLVTVKCGKWVEAEGEMSRLDCPESQGVMWWGARPRIFPSGNTVEWRPFPSLIPQHAAALAGETLRLARTFDDFVRGGVPPIRGIDNVFVRSLYRELSTLSPLVPAQPLSDDEWWRQFAL